MSKQKLTRQGIRDLGTTFVKRESNCFHAFQYPGTPEEQKDHYLWTGSMPDKKCAKCGVLEGESA